jgi:hypothetical protein
MRTWIALATYDDSGEREAVIGDLNYLDKVAVFEARDGEMPTDQWGVRVSESTQPDKLREFDTTEIPDDATITGATLRVSTQPTVRRWLSLRWWAEDVPQWWPRWLWLLIYAAVLLTMLRGWIFVFAELVK